MKIDKFSIKALKKLCRNKRKDSTKSFLNKIYTNHELNYIMLMTNTYTFNELVDWLTNSELEEHLNIINNFNN